MSFTMRSAEVPTGYDMDELYMFDIKSHTWRPAARYLHSAVVVGDSMVIFGGNDKASGDVWSFNFATRRWKQLSKVQLFVA